MLVRHALLVSSVLAVVLAGTQACTIGNTATKEDKICTPDAYVFCRCADRAEGTKQCKPDGLGFAACTTDTRGTCSGGEIEDPRTNQPVQRTPSPSDIGKDDPPDAIQVCPGKSTAVIANQEMKLEGDTTTAIGDRVARAGACAVGKDGKDHVYRLVPTGSGTLNVAIKGEAGLTPLVYIRTACDDAETQVACGPPASDGTASLRLNVQTGKDYFLVVDAASGTAGKYTATVKLTTSSFCGDGVVDTGEACDDGNHVEDDGCSASCQQVNGNPASGGSCPGHPVHVWPNKTVTGTGSTNPYASSWSAPSGSCTTGTNDAPDHVYAVTPHAEGTLVVSLAKQGTSALNDHMLIARRACTDPQSSTAGMCANQLGIGGLETMSFLVRSDETIFVAVDGGNDPSNKGDYTISFKLK